MIGGFARGVYSFADGMMMLASRPSLWPLALAPLGIAVAAVVAGVWFGTDFVAEHAPLLSHLRFHLGIDVRLDRAIAFAIAALASLLLAKVLVIPLFAGPFLAKISSAAEEMRHGQLPRPPAPAVHAAIATSLGTVLFGMIVLVVWLPVLLLPVGGAVLYMLPAAYVESLNALDYTFGRRGMSLGEKRAWLRAHAGAALGLGGAIVFCSLIPFLNFVAAPAAAAGGALLVRQEDSRDDARGPS